MCIDTMDNIKNMVDNGNLSDAISQISPEMIQNFSSMMKNTDSSTQTTNQNNGQNSNQNINSEVNQTSYNKGSFDFSNIDMNTILKMKSVMEKLNQKDDPRSNLLYSLKPYLRDEKKEKLDQYTNLLNVAKIAELFKNDNKETSKND